MNWQDNVTALAQYAGDANLASDPDFLAQMPRFIEAAEQRIFRDMDLLSTVVEDPNGTLAQGRRRFVLPTDQAAFVVLQGIRLIVGGVVQRPLNEISREAMDTIYPGGGPVGSPSIPHYWAPFDQVSVLVGPAPDQAYQAICTGTQRPQPLYTGTITTTAGLPGQGPTGTPSATGTFISNNLPDVFIAAQMIDVSAWQRQFGAGDLPQQAVSWSTEYDKLKATAQIEEFRKKLQSLGWTSRLPTPAQPPQT